MRGSLIVLGLFFAGIIIGRFGNVPDECVSAELTEWLLYALVVQIGLSLGYGGNLRRIFKEVSLRTLLLPVAQGFHHYDDRLYRPYHDALPG